MKARHEAHIPGSSNPAGKELRLAKRIAAALNHPNCPQPLFGFDNIDRIARHVASRLNRNYADDD